MIIGVNGFGKIILLNVFYCVLVGFKDVFKNDIVFLGSVGYIFMGWWNSNYFCLRVKDGVLNVIIVCKIFFGDEYLEIIRKLLNLEVILLKLNDVILFFL